MFYYTTSNLNQRLKLPKALRRNLIILCLMAMSLVTLHNNVILAATGPGPASLVKEVMPQYQVDANGILYFSVGGLWKSDGTAAGTVMIKNIEALHLTNVNGAVYFDSHDSTHGRELWKSDGTAAGTVLVKDIMQGSYGGDPDDLTNVNGTLYFRANDGIHGRELWISDGTAAGTHLVKDINPGNNYSEPWDLTNVNGTLYFSAYDGIHGSELWKSDGTVTGTMLVKDINPGSASSGPRDLTNVNGTLYFVADDSNHGFELWKSDGTASGTKMVKDIDVVSHALPTSLTNVNGTLFFRTHGELWKSDGTAAGTVLVKDINPYYNSLTNVNGTLYFSAGGLWKSDGTAAGTVLVKDINPRDLTNVNGTLYFRADDGMHGEELWKSDGTTAGTVLAQDIIPGAEGSYPDNFTVSGSQLFFSASIDNFRGALWSINLESSQTSLPIVDAKVPVREFNKNNLFDGNITTSWNTDGNPDNAWFELILDSPYELTNLKLAPRTARAYKFNVYVDNGFVGQYTTASNPIVELQSFALPAGTAGQVIRVEAVNQNWFKIYEVELTGQPTMVSDTLTIVDTDVPVRAPSKSNLHDGNLSTSWNNDGNIANAWFDVMLDSAQAITELRLAPRINRAYTFNVYVDHVFVDQYTTASAPTIALQSFALPPGTSGSHIRIESLNHNWFKVHEIELYNGAPNVDTCGNELSINEVTVPAREFRKRYLVDDDFSSTSFWSNSGETWFELSLNAVQEINCLQLAPRENRTYTFDLYVDDNFVAQYTTEKANTISLQNFRLPEGTMGSVVRIESLNSNWFKVHEVKLHGGFVNVALNSSVQLKGAPFFTGGWGSGQIVSASTIVDGIFLPRSRQWDQGAVWWDSTDGLERYIDINLDGTYSIHSFIVQADDNDPYDLLYWDLTTNSWRLAWAVPNYNAYGSGMQTRPNPEDDTIKHTLSSPVTTNALRLKGVPNIGSIGYSVSEIQAFGLKQ